MGTYVWVDSWQQQCCGDDFRVGSIVSWNAKLQERGHEWVTQLLGEEWGLKIKFHEEHHDDNDDEKRVTISGIVKSINVVTCDRTLEYVTGPGHRGPVRVLVPRSGRLTAVDVADPWVSKPDDHSSTFDGWIVELELAGPT